VGILVVKVTASLPQVGPDVATVAITWLVVGSFVAVGLALLGTDLPPVNGWSCLVVAAATIPGDLNDTHYPAAARLIGFALEPCYLAATVALVLRYPSARLSAVGHVTVWGILVSSVLLRMPLGLTVGSLPSPFHRPQDLGTLALRPWWHDWVFLRAPYTVTILFLCVAGVLLVLRVVVPRGITRQSLAPLAGVGTICAVAAAVDHAVWVAGVPGPAWDAVAVVRNLSAAVIPVALLADLLRRRAAEAAVTTDVLLAASSGNLDALQSSLRHVLVDPSLTITAVPQPSHVDGVPPFPDVPASDAEDRESTTLTGADGSALATITYDRRANSDEALLRASLSAAQVGIDNTRLTAALLERMAELEASRTRIVEAGLAERRRVERDLHDGAQQHFLSVAATLAQADFADDQELRSLVKQARVGLGGALAELRDLARGIHPASLSQGGLSTALPALCERSPQGVHLRIDAALEGRRLDADVETAVYFVVAEGLVNATRYAEASAVAVDVALSTERLVVEVADDGRGGAGFAPGRGLTGLRDRVQALGGDFDAHSDPCATHPSSRGTRLTATLPVGRTAP
jgi:signal transduction histidine kinase